MTLASQQVANNVLTPTLPTTANTTYFVELLLKQNGTLVDRNVYWEPTTGDVINWNKTTGSPQASMSSYANMNALQSLPRRPSAPPRPRSTRPARTAPTG